MSQNPFFTGNPIRRSFSQGDSRRLSFSQESVQNGNYSQFHDRRVSMDIGSLSQKTSLSSGDSDYAPKAIEDTSIRSVSKFDEFTLRSRHNDVCNKLDGIDSFIRSSADSAKKSDLHILEELKSLQSGLLEEVKRCFHSIQDMQRTQHTMMENVSNLSLLVSSSNKSISQLVNLSLELPNASIITDVFRSAALRHMSPKIHQSEERQSTQICTKIAAASAVDPNSDMSDSDSESNMNCMSVTEYIALKRRRISPPVGQQQNYVQDFASSKESSPNIFNDSSKYATYKDSSLSVISATDSLSIPRSKIASANLNYSVVNKPSIFPPQLVKNFSATAPLSVEKAKIIEQIYRTASSKSNTFRKIFSNKEQQVETESSERSNLGSAHCESDASFCKNSRAGQERPKLASSVKAGSNSRIVPPPISNPEMSGLKQSSRPVATQIIEAIRPPLTEPTLHGEYTMNLVVNKIAVGKSSSIDIPQYFPLSDPVVGKSWFTFSTSNKLYYPLSVIRVNDSNDRFGSKNERTGRLPNPMKVCLTIRSECSDEEDEPEDFTTQTTASNGIFWFAAIRSVHVTGRVLIHFSCPDAPHVRPLILRVPIILQSDPKFNPTIQSASSTTALTTIIEKTESLDEVNSFVENHSSTILTTCNDKNSQSESQKGNKTPASLSQWTEEEVDNLLRGFERYRGRRLPWVKIKSDPDFAKSLQRRTADCLEKKYSKIKSTDQTNPSSVLGQKEASNCGGSSGKAATAKPLNSSMQSLPHIQYTMELVMDLSHRLSCPIPQSFQLSDPLPGFEDSWFIIPVSNKSKCYMLSIARIAAVETNCLSKDPRRVEICPAVNVSLSIRSELSGDTDDPTEYTTKASPNTGGIYRFVAVESVHVPGQVLFHFSCPDAPYVRPLSFTVPVTAPSLVDPCPNPCRELPAMMSPSTSQKIPTTAVIVDDAEKGVAYLHEKEPEEREVLFASLVKRRKGKKRKNKEHHSASSHPLSAKLHDTRNGHFELLSKKPQMKCDKSGAGDDSCREEIALFPKQPTAGHRDRCTEVDPRSEATCATQPGDLTWLEEWGLPTGRHITTTTTITSSSSSAACGVTLPPSATEQTGPGSPGSVLSTETEMQWAGCSERSRIVGAVEQQTALFNMDTDPAQYDAAQRMRSVDDDDDDDKTCITSFEAQ